MANKTERVGVLHCGEIAERNGWLFREQPVNDIGIDAHIEFIDSENKPKQLLALQIKAGSSWFEEKNDGYVVFRHMNERQFAYWTMNSLPCVLVLYNPDDNLCIWQELSKRTIERTNDGKGGGFLIKVPMHQVFLDKASTKQLLSLTNLPEHLINYNFLLSQKCFMEIIQNGGTVKLHSQEWVNKSSGRGQTELIVQDEQGITKTYSYPYWFPFTSYTEVFPKLFPWATFSADQDFFEEYDKEKWKELNFWHDKETGESIMVGEPFEDFRKSLSPMRNIDHIGEVAEYMMVLGLNELGKAFLAVEQFVSKENYYSGARPKEKKAGGENGL